MEQNFIEVRNLKHVYGSGAKATIALRGVDLTIGVPEYVAMIGQNGAGKTTLVKHFNGLLRPTEGEVLVDGIPTSTKTTAELSSKVGYCFQNPDDQICEDTVMKEVSFGLVRKGFPKDEIEKRALEALEKLDLVRYKEEHPFIISKGLRQRVAVASVVALEPRILVVDEPTTGQDWRESLEIMNYLDRLHSMGNTVIIITHDVNLVAKHAKRTIIMAKGKILFDGPTRNAFDDPNKLKEAYVKPPQITQLSLKIRPTYGFAANILTPEEMITEMKNKLNLK